jgi:hypothetical protein
MSNKLALTTVTMLVALPVSLGLAAKPAKPTISINLNPTTVTYGNNTAVSGALSTGAAGVTATREWLAFPFSGPFATAESMATTAGGNYSFRVLGTQTARFQVSAGSKPTVTSAVVNLLVRRRIGLLVGDLTPAKGQRVRFVGVSKPADAGATVAIQRRALVGWKTIATTTLRAATATASTYGLRIRASKSGRYRATVGGSLGYLAGASPARHVAVHR